MNKTHTPDFGTIPAHIKLWRAGKIADAYLEQENALVLAQVEHDRLRSQVEELRGALEKIKLVANDYTVALPIPAMRMYEIAHAALKKLERE